MSDQISPPSGTVTFLFTDVEGSTRLWADDAAAMAASLRAHDELVREEVASRGGYVFTTAGDSFCVAFGRVSDALACAQAVQLRLRGASWPGPALTVRIGLHLGEAEERGGDYFGPVVNLAARVETAGHGGQVLLTDAVRLAAPDVEVRDLGEHRLRGFNQPVRLWQLGVGEFPPLRSEGSLAGNLPVQVSSFVGRRGDIDSVLRFLREDRLVSLTGVGGVGKSRLALSAASALTPDVEGGVWLVELAPVGDPKGVVGAVAATLGVAAPPGGDLTDAVVAHLASREMLLILDNCEHVVDAVRDLLARILSGCAKVSLLVTSREALGISGERVVAVHPLDASSVSAPAVELFSDRARAAGAQLAEMDMSLVVEICQRLDGIPLAVELAAARMVAMSPEQLRDRIDDRFRLLSGGRRTLERHQTLRQTVQWSFDLLDDRERLMMGRLSVFSGGFDLPAAAAVGADAGLDEIDVLDVLDSLTRKSLLQAERAESTARYRMLETIRQFGEEQLGLAGEADMVRDTHAGFFADQVDHYHNLFRSPEEDRTFRWIDREMGNLTTAFQWASERNLADIGIRIAGGCHQFARSAVRTETHGWAARWVDEARTLGHPKLPLLLTMASDSSWAQLDLENAIRFGEEAISMAGDDRFEPFVWAFTDLAVIAGYNNDLERAIDLARKGADQPADARDRLCLAFWLYLLAASDPRAAREVADEVVATVRAAGVRWVISIALLGQAASHEPRDPALAHALRHRALDVVDGTGNRFAIQTAEQAIASSQLHAQAPEVALRSLSGLVETWGRTGDSWLARSLADLTVVFGRLGNHEAVATLTGVLDSAFRGDAPGLDDTIAVATTNLGARFADLRLKGAILSSRDAADYAQAEIARVLAGGEVADHLVE